MHRLGNELRLVRGPLAWPCTKLGKLIDLVSVLNNGLVLDRMAVKDMFTEYWTWKRVYIPKGGVEGKTVLDVGAGAGETADLYFKHGAKRVIGLEWSQERARLFRINAERRGWDAEVLVKRFEPADLEHGQDFTKVDIEGYEALLLGGDVKLGPMSVEVHNFYLFEEFEKRGFTRATDFTSRLGECVMVNW